MKIFYDPTEPRCKNITGGIEQNREIVINVFGDPSQTGPCQFVLQKDGCEARPLAMDTTESGWTISFSLHECGLYFYWFLLEGRKYGCGEMHKMEEEKNIPPFQLLIYAKDFETPDWLKGGVMYQIFPDRFYRSGEIQPEAGKWLHKNWNDAPEYRPDSNGKILNNDFFGGNFRGIMEKLDYLQDLHVTVLYLNPVFKAFSNHRYDTGDYMQIDPLLGSEKDFVEFVRACQDRGISVILDGVFNHTGADSRYFNKYGHYDSVGAYQSPYSKYYAWYNFKKYPDIYDCWWGIDILPAVNEENDSYVEFITGEDGVLRHWMRAGVAGFRLDVADELPDAFIEKIRSAIRAEKQDALLIGEVWEDASNKISYSKRRRYFYGTELDSVMNYPLKDAIIEFVLSKNTRSLRETICMLLDHYPKKVLDSLMNILGTHDTSRILTVLGGVQVCGKDEMSFTFLSEQDRAHALDRLRFAAVLQFTLFGVPCIYYGDEVGMEGYSDPFCRRTFAWDHIDENLHDFYRRLAFLRSESEVFREGIYREIIADEQCIVFERRTPHHVVVTGVNLGEGKYDICFDHPMYDCFSGVKFLGKYTISPHKFCILSDVRI